MAKLLRGVSVASQKCMRQSLACWSPGSSNNQLATTSQLEGDGVRQGQCQSAQLQIPKHKYAASNKSSNNYNNSSELRQSGVSEFRKWL